MPPMTILSHSFRPVLPQLTSWMPGSRNLSPRAHLVASRTYSSADIAPICHSPYISLPRPQSLTR
jgi:hypothetical protein